MRKQLYWLNDAEWKRIEPLLPRGRRGAHRVDDRRVISGIMHMLRSGARWRDCPPDYGPYTTIYNRFNRWSRPASIFGAFSSCGPCPRRTKSGAGLRSKTLCRHGITGIVPNPRLRRGLRISTIPA